MDRVSVSIQYLLDKENRFGQLSKLINSDGFMAAVSLAPGAVMVARTIGKLSQSIVATLLSDVEQQGILTFSGDLNLSEGSLREGYYVILGTRDERNPIPAPLPKLSVEDGLLLGDGHPILTLSYVILDVRRVDARTRALNDGAPWDGKLKLAEATAQRVGSNPLASDDDREQGWRECLSSLKEGQVLILSDSNYLASEAQNIMKSSYANCYSEIFAAKATRGGASRKSVGAGRRNDRVGRASIAIPEDEDLSIVLNQYAQQVIASRAILTSANVT
jgi:hypothetical protein